MSTEIIFQRLKYIQVDIDKLQLLNIKDISDLNDFKNFHLVERLIEKIIDCAIDINNYLLREYFNESVVTSKESFMSLGKEGMLTEDFANEISKSVGLRNTIIHQYQQLDEKILFDAIQLTIEGYGKYCNEIIKWLEDKNI